jgi:methanogen homoisocitrate dehydrogenase
VRVVVVEGDGIGKEVIPVAQKILARCLPDAEFYPLEVGYGRWERTGSAIGDDDFVALKAADAVLFGAVTTPPDPCYRSVIVRIRQELDLYANVRPVFGKDFSVTIVRENTEGLYAGVETVEEDRATTLRVLSRKGCTRIARFAAERAKERDAALTIAHKANVLKSDTFFRTICIKEAEAVGVRWNEAYIDALCLDILVHPGRYSVIVTTNLFGDILSDVAAYLAGGLGLLPSANIGDGHALFEPVHGSAPDIAGQDRANPIAAIRSAALLLAYFGETELSSAVEDAIGMTLAAGYSTPDLGGNCGTNELGAHVEEALCRILAGPHA